LYKEAHTPFEWHQVLFDHAKSLGIELLSTPFDETSTDLLDSLNVSAFKIASFELTDIPLIKYVAEKKKPLIISTGLGTLHEISSAVNAAQSVGNYEIILLHCIIKLSDASGTIKHKNYTSFGKKHLMLFLGFRITHFQILLQLRQLP
jgi:sialic acid synthase SpsE